MNYRDCKTYREFAQAASLGVSTQGWLTAGDIENFYQLARQLKPGDLCVIIGLYRGAQAILAKLVAPEATVVGIDPFTNDTEFKIHRRHLEDCCRDDMTAAGVWSDVEVIAQPSQDVGPTWNRPIKLLLVDGAHEEQPAYLDMLLFGRWVVPGGHMCLDDMNVNGDVRKAFHRWCNQQAPGDWEIVTRFGDEEPATDKMWVLRRI